MIHGMKRTHGEELHRTKVRQTTSQKIPFMMGRLPRQIRSEMQCPRRLRGGNGVLRWDLLLWKVSLKDGVLPTRSLLGYVLMRMVQALLKGGLLVVQDLQVLIQGGPLLTKEVLEFSALTAFHQGGMLVFMCLRLLVQGGLLDSMYLLVFFQGGLRVCRYLLVFLQGGPLDSMYFRVFLQGGLSEQDQVLADVPGNLVQGDRYNHQKRGQLFPRLGRGCLRL